MRVSIVVEGKKDKARLQQVLDDRVYITCTFGTPSNSQLNDIAYDLRHDEVYIFTDNDTSGKKIRALLSEHLPDASHIYTRRGYKGVEGTPHEYLALQLEKAGLEEFVTFQANPASNWIKDEF